MECRLDLSTDSIYTYEDFNRLEENCKELCSILNNMGIPCQIVERGSLWSYSDIVYATDMDRLVSNIKILKEAYNTSFPETIVPNLPPLFSSGLDTVFTYSYFDKIEKNLYYIDSTIKATEKAILYSGYTFSGNTQYMLRGGM